MPALDIRTPKTTYNPGEVAKARANCTPDYVITCIIDGEEHDSSVNLPFSLSITQDMVGKDIVFEVVKGTASDTCSIDVEHPD